MKGVNGQYLNEIVSLIVLALMAIALIAGQAGATLPDSAAGATDARRQPFDAIGPASVIRADVAIEIDFEAFAALVNINQDDRRRTRVTIRTAGRL